ncbi:probable cytochrome P450 6a14 [Macrosteles quadrilineatus]|uniref:probable cytochrome P450 6a14 n=1 Tax=Macrosteles quadrilineatus TaxID=74068 RepID=UPI0023E27B89|nr:probable cytochrome P450 6a14 [Macrosteles quadrilineatus]
MQDAEMYGGSVLGRPKYHLGYQWPQQVIETILVEDFSFFKDRWVKFKNPLVDSLTFGKGEEWRERRLRIAPAFGPGKVRGMFQQIFGATDGILKEIEDQNAREECIEIENLANQFSIDVMSSCLFGVNMLHSREAILIKKALDEMYVVSKSHPIITMIGLKYPKIFDFLYMIKGYRDAIISYVNVINDIIQFRAANKTKRNDILQVMLDLEDQDEEISENVNKSKAEQTNVNNATVTSQKSKHIFSHELIAATIHNFYHAGIKPTAVTIMFALYEIARHPEIQGNLVEEVKSSLTKCKGWNPCALERMTYLDQVIQETLRLYSFNISLSRVLTKPYTLPGTNVTLDEGMNVFVPIDAIHRDPEFYPEPEKFRPERFDGHHYKPTSTFLPFGQGPRICVAIRMAVTTVKLCLARILAQYQVKIADKMQLPLELIPSEFYPRPKGGMWLQFVPRENVTQ